MKIKKFLNDAINRYSYHSIIWITLSVLIMCALFITYIFAPHSGGESRTTAFLLLISYFPAVYFPLVIFLTIFIFKILNTKENKNVDFRIKNHILTSTIAIKIAFPILLIISGILLLCFLYIAIWTMLQPYSNYDRLLFVYITIPLLIFITIVYLVIRKKFLHD